MNIRIVACAWAAVLAAQVSPAGAAAWVWGCKGQLESEQIIFTKFALLVAPLKPARGHIRDIVRKDNLIRNAEDENNSYDAMNDEFGLQPVMKFARGSQHSKKVTFTEQPSQRPSRKTPPKRGRVENAGTLKKTYRFEREDQPARDIAMDCVEYQFTPGARR